MLAAYLRSAPNGPSAHGFTTLARRAMQSGGLKGVMAIGTLGLHVGLSSPVWVGALTVTGVTYACCIIGNLNARHSLRSALQATLTEVSRTEASAGPTWAQVSDLVNAAQRASAPQTPISLYAPKLQLVCSTPEPAQGAGSLPQTPQPSLLHRRRRTSIDLELEEVVTGDETQGHGLGGMPHSPRFLGSLLRRCADPSPRSASFAGDAATSNGGASPSPRNSTFGLSRSRATSMAGHGNAEAISPTNPTHQ
ncbi:hypothetical protein FA09DRAFT_28394 [Tilletiopsis washingtonensis]|uniref:Uncharacterized protein n=1 Tax=Tilletiopsis washingtonensis TaxID=58919 RepID=A0A316Z9Z6_9BASI|nr:hypothetical protein FA09DRAFT_28394 [Tilletiopsis washingtonensis]PWN97828.1 hypothetical protein FA09DRAFT_28394 [Tilletiopsis washingtonensis]